MKPYVKKNGEKKGGADSVQKETDSNVCDIYRPQQGHQCL